MMISMIMIMTMCGAPVSPPPASGRVIRLPPSRGKAKGRNRNYHEDEYNDHDDEYNDYEDEYNDHDGDVEGPTFYNAK